MSNYFHVAFLVADIDAAVARFSKLLDIEFNEVRTHKAPMVWLGERMTRDVRVTYSKVEPFIELIEGHPDGVLSLENGEGFHHLGTWAPEYGSAEWQEKFGDLEIETTVPDFNDPDGPVTALSAPRCTCGIRLELVDKRRKGPLLTWATGVFHADEA